MRKRLIVTQIIVMAIVIVFIGAAFSIVGNSSHNTKIDNATSYVQLTQRNITMTGNVTNNFRGDLVGTNNMPSPWGVNNVVKGLYLTYNSSDLFIGVDENISGNSLMVFLTNVSEAIYGTYNIAGMNTWNRNINFTDPMSYFAAVYFSGTNTGPSTPDAFSISNYITSSSSPVATQIQSSFVFSSVNNTTEITIPWSGMFPNGYSGQLSFAISAFVVGGSGTYVGSGIPYYQKGVYNDGGQSSFQVNNTIPITISNLIIKATPSYKDYPSYLLLNNFKNNSIWVSTGVPDSYLGSPYDYESLSIQTIDINNVTLPLQAYFDTSQATTSANLTANNTVMVKTSKSTVYLMDPPYENQFGAIQISNASGSDSIDVNGVYSHIMGTDYVYINTSPGLYIHYSNAKASVTVGSNSMSISITTNPGTSYVTFSESQNNAMNATQMFSVNERNVDSWLSKGIQPQLFGQLRTEYNMSLLLVKDDQNPMTGEIAASPSPVYLYTWVRDGSFSAMSLQDAGHIQSALKYWKWMASEQGNDIANGTWQTRFDFWTGSVSTDWIAPEYDSVGLFQMGIYNLFEITHNISMVSGFLNDINYSLAFEENSIATYGLIPEDHSIWEQQLGYYFWTQSIDDIGMKDGIMLLSQTARPGFIMPGMPPVPPGSQQKLQKLEINYTLLTGNILKDFYADGIFAQYITPISSQYPGNGQPATYYLMNNTPDASQILPIAMGFMNPNSPLSQSVVSNVVSILENHKVGGLPRYYNDLYHYTAYGGYLQSSGPSPPWIITTLFLGDYDESAGNMSGALSILSWATNHTQSGLLPEAVDPNFGTVIASTSPLTWSSAMYVMVSLGYSNINILPPHPPSPPSPPPMLL
jgi:GH15 family glucan-1,4-alpha-glucosidase